MTIKSFGRKGLAGLTNKRTDRQQLIRFFIIFLTSTGMTNFTRAQLAIRNGQDRPQVWVAYKGLIYDVTESRLWRNGMHYEHWAGQDLTDELPDAPHSERVFDRFEVVGVLV